MKNKGSGALIAAVALALLATPGQTQNFSDSYTFLKAVRERDGTKVTDLVSVPGSIVVNSTDRSNGEGALHILVEGRDLNWLTFLLAKGARPDIQNDEGMTPLGIAARLGWVEGAQALLDRGASVDLANKRGETPLIFAVLNRNPAMVRLLLAKGANPQHTDSVAGYSALDYAKRDRRSAGIAKMLEAPAVRTGDAIGPSL